MYYLRKGFLQEEVLHSDSIYAFILSFTFYEIMGISASFYTTEKVFSALLQVEIMPVIVQNVNINVTKLLKVTK